MASSFTVTGSNTKIDFNWTAATTTMLSIVGDAAEYAWSKGYGNHGGGVTADGTPIPANEFASLTNSQKLALVEEYLKDTVIGCSNMLKSSKAQAAARAEAEANKYSL